MLNNGERPKPGTTIKNSNFTQEQKNLTNIKFNKEEMDGLSHGLQHGVERPLEI